MGRRENKGWVPTFDEERRRLTVREVADAGGHILLACMSCNTKIDRPALELVPTHGHCLVAFMPARCIRCSGGTVKTPLTYTSIIWPAGRRPPPKAMPVTTLRQAIAAGRALYVKCRACGRSTYREGELIERWIVWYGKGADDIALADLQRRLKCQCGAKAATIRTDVKMTR